MTRRLTWHLGQLVVAGFACSKEGSTLWNALSARIRSLQSVIALYQKHFLTCWLVHTKPWPYKVHMLQSQPWSLLPLVSWDYMYSCSLLVGTRALKEHSKETLYEHLVHSAKCFPPVLQANPATTNCPKCHLCTHAHTSNASCAPQCHGYSQWVYVSWYKLSREPRGWSGGYSG